MKISTNDAEQQRTRKPKNAVELKSTYRWSGLKVIRVTLPYQFLKSLTTENGVHQFMFLKVVQQFICSNKGTPM